MLVRNRTKVPLRVELRHPPKQPSPFSECLQRLFSNCWVQPAPLLVAEVRPGIEWDLRPSACRIPHSIAFGFLFPKQ